MRFISLLHYPYIYIYTCLGLGDGLQGSMHLALMLGRDVALNAIRYALEICQKKANPQPTSYMIYRSDSCNKTHVFNWLSTTPCADASFGEHLLSTLGRGVAWVQGEEPTNILIDCYPCMSVRFQWGGAWWFLLCGIYWGSFGSWFTRSGPCCCEGFLQALPIMEQLDNDLCFLVSISL